MKYINKKEENVKYRKRPGSYAIITRKKDKKIGIVTDGKNNFYLGGGIEENETKIMALRREIIEESGYMITNIKKFATVGSFLRSETNEYLEVIANVYIVEFEEKITEPIEEDHTLLWVNAEDYIGKMYREWQENVLKEFIRKFRNNTKN